ncbi:MAG: hypothetical protein C4299_04300, partial [Thermoleophilia bacterium]
REALACRRVSARGRLYVEIGQGEVVEAKLRYRSPAVPARVVSRRGGFLLELAEPVEAVAPGQAAVLYQEDAVVGFGVVTGTRAA